MLSKRSFTDIRRLTRAIRWSILLAISLEAGPIRAETTPLDKELKALLSSPKSLNAEVYVLKIFDLWDTVGASPVIDALTRISKMTNVSGRVRNRAEYLLAEAEIRQGELAQATKRFEKSGFIDRWIVAGPFDNEGGTGLDAADPSQTAASLDPSAPMPGKAQEVYWRDLPEEAYRFGYTYLSALHDPTANTCFLARASLNAKKRASAILRIGAGGAFRALWNGKVALVDDKYRFSDPDRFAAAIDIEEGENTLLVKVCTEEKGDFGFYARLTNRKGAPQRLLPDAHQLDKPFVARVAKSTPKPIPEPLETLLKLSESKPTKAKIQAEAAEFLLWTSSQNLDDHDARDMAKRACETEPSERYCLLWSTLALERNEERLAIATGQRKEPGSVALLLARAEWEADGPSGSAALHFTKQVLKLKPDNWEAQLIEIDVLSRRGFVKTAFERAQLLLKAHPDIPKLMEYAASAAERSGRRADSLALTEKTLAYHFEDTQKHMLLAHAALGRGDTEALDRYLGAMSALAPYEADIHAYIAEAMEGLGEMGRAEEALRKCVTLAPKSADAWKGLGLFLMRRDRRDEGMEALGNAAAIAPQDVWLADYLGHIGSDGRFEESFVIPDTVFLGWRQDQEARPESKYLVDQKVVKVYDSGLASSFVQTVFEIGNREDAKEWRTRAIQFTTSSQEVRLLAARIYHPDGSVEKVVARGVVSVSEPWYRLYYDVAAEMMEFPRLAPKDVVELQYRIDDTSVRNIFNDYFGDFFFIQDEYPKHFWRYGLIASKKRHFQFNQPKYRGLHHAQESVGESVQYTFEAEDVPAIVQEGDMPGPSEVAPYLHVSTYASWQALGEWYRGLVRHQMVPDERIRNQVKALVAGKKSEIERIEAIHNWVVTATRYVGLEFGIHGYKPYRAPLIASRGFGDCKDKATLLITMLKEAGIDAAFVLIRTNDLGTLEASPASLAVFNHAIAYIPKVDLYLDPTAEHHGIYELPFQDQGATALVLKKEGAVLVTTPVAPPKRNTQRIESRVIIDDKGNADIESHASVLGNYAAALRQSFEAEATRRERFEGSLAQSYPGARLKELEMGSLTDLSKPVTYRYTAAVPAYALFENGEYQIPVDEGLNLVATYARLESRKHDLMVGPEMTISLTTDIKVPSGYTADPVEPLASADSKFGTLALEVTQKGDAIRISRKFVLKVARVDSGEYPDFVRFARQVDDILGRKITIRRAR